MDKDEIHNAFCYYKILLTSGGSPPCQECAASKSECIFDPFQDRRRKVALQTTQNEAHNHQHILIYLVHTLQYGTDEAKILKEDIKRSSSPDDAIVYLQLLLFEREDWKFDSRLPIFS